MELPYTGVYAPPSSYRLPNKSVTLLELSLETPKTKGAVVIALGCPLEPDVKTLLLKTYTDHRTWRNQVNTDWKMSSFLIVFIVSEVAMRASGVGVGAALSTILPSYESCELK